MARRSDHSRDEIRSMALDAALRIVETDGHTGLSARKVTQAIGYTVGTLYLVFDNLDDLILQLNGRTIDELLQRLNTALSHCNSHEECLRALASGYIDFAADHTHRWRLMFEHRLPDGATAPVWFTDKVDQLFTILGNTLKPLMPNASKAAIEQSVQVLWGGVHGICVLQLGDKLGLSGSQSEAHELARFLIDTHLLGIARH